MTVLPILSCEGALRFFPSFGDSVWLHVEVGLLELTEKVRVVHVGLSLASVETERERGFKTAALTHRLAQRGGGGGKDAYIIRVNLSYFKIVILMILLSAYLCFHFISFYSGNHPRIRKTEKNT